MVKKIRTFLFFDRAKELYEELKKRGYSAFFEEDDEHFKVIWYEE